LEKVFSPDPNVGFVSHAMQYGEALAAGQLVAPAKTLTEMTRIVVNDYIDATLAAVFVLVVISTVIYGLISIRKALATPQATAMEIGLAGAVAGGQNA
jgi:carbon starvation protein